ncbi:hypothetical protein HK096_008577 [Nowakowskiella sp. JEL0078]|nr:hypothetical protein HK096_008577 [Nowakowskiella sp. JEL0078]
MSSTRQRKSEPKEEHEEGKPEEKKSEKETIKAAKTSWLSAFLFAFIFTSLITLGISYLITDSFTFGVAIPNLRKYFPRRELVFTPEELLQYDGSDLNKPVYIAIL